MQVKVAVLNAISQNYNFFADFNKAYSGVAYFFFGGGGGTTRAFSQPLIASSATQQHSGRDKLSSLQKIDM